MDISEDIVQTTIINIWHRRTELKCKNADDLENYLYKSTYNNTLTHLRQKNLHQKHQERIFIELMDTGSDFSDFLINKELEIKIHSEVENLPEKSKEIFVLSRFHGLKNKDIALKLNVTEKNIEYHITNALKKLREKLKEYAMSIIFWIIYFWSGSIN